MSREVHAPFYEGLVVKSTGLLTKKIGRFEKIDLETAVTSALQQIEDRHYAQELLDRGIQKILNVGLAFEGKKVLIRSKFSS